VSLRAEFCKHDATTHHDAMGQMTQTTAGSPPRQGEKREGVWGYLVWLGLARLAASWGAWETGFRALSDDDYARVTLAQRFAEHPKIDPSGTSWLPFPFWVMGTAMKLLDPSLDVARATSSALAIGATWLLFAAGRVWGFTDRQALAAALVATALPVVTVLGSATVPELPTAALSAFALVAVSARSDRARRSAWSPSLLASVAMIPATLSRYETWPVAVVVSVCAALHRDDAKWRRAVASALPLLGPAWWIVHNRVAHGDALSFLHRVSSYRAALGSVGTHGGPGYALALVSGCPEMLIACCGLLFMSLRNSEDGAARQQLLKRFVPWAIGALSLFVFLVAGDLLGGSPTHHPERALLLVWLLASFVVVDLAVLARPPRWLALLVLPLLAIDYRSALSDRGVDRRSEETIGTQLRSLVPKGERVFIATSDYGYFAVVAAFGRPSDSIIDQTHDPRSKDEASLVLDHLHAADRLSAAGAMWLVAPSTIVLPMVFRERTRDARLAIYELEFRADVD